MATKPQEPALFSIPTERLMADEEAGSESDLAVSSAPVQVNFDSTPIQKATKGKIVETAAGPMRVRERITTVTLYRADGTEAVVPAAGMQRYLNKRDEYGKQVFFTRPPMKPPANVRICKYCFKKFRNSTLLEIASADNRSKFSDPEVQRLLRESGYADEESGTVNGNDADYKLAMHIRARHGKLAAFTGDPLFERLRDTSAAVE